VAAQHSKWLSDPKNWCRYRFRASALAKIESFCRKLTKIVAGILHSYKSFGRADLIVPWAAVLQQLPILESNELVRTVIADAAKFAAKKEKLKPAAIQLPRALH
jgi:hypothetical protein